MISKQLLLTTIAIVSLAEICFGGVTGQVDPAKPDKVKSGLSKPNMSKYVEKSPSTDHLKGGGNDLNRSASMTGGDGKNNNMKIIFSPVKFVWRRLGNIKNLLVSKSDPYAKKLD